MAQLKYAKAVGIIFSSDKQKQKKISYDKLYRNEKSKAKETQKNCDYFSLHFVNVTSNN